MNRSVSSCREFFQDFNGKYSGNREAWVAPQSIHLMLVKSLAQGVSVGAQNVSEHLEGAFTGELSPKTLKDAGGSFVILGHSERRQYFAENSRGLSAKIKSSLCQGLKV